MKPIKQDGTLSLLCEANEVGTLLLTQNNNNTGYENNNVHQILQLRTLVKTSRCTQFPFPRILLHKAPRKASMKRYFKNRLFQFWIQIQVSTCLKWKRKKITFPSESMKWTLSFQKNNNKKKKFDRQNVTYKVISNEQSLTSSDTCISI